MKRQQQVNLQYKTKIVGSTAADNIRFNTKAVDFKDLTNFWRSFDLLLINCEIEFDLSW